MRIKVKHPNMQLTASENNGCNYSI